MKHIPVIFVTAMNTHEAQAEAYNAGGEDFIAKPIYAPVVRSRVAAHLSRYQQLSQLQKMVEVQTQQLTQTRLEIIKTLSVAAEFKDDDTGMHVIRMAHYARLLAEAYLPNDNAFGQLIFNAAPMHDIGKIGIADSILKKPGRLTPEEMDEMRKHPELGIKILREHPSELITVAREVALTHHERWNDPMGYPNKLSGEDIPIAGRIVAIADVFDALTSVRPYKQAWPIERAVQLFKDESGKHFDPTLVDLFLERLPEVLQIKEQYQEHFPEAA
jgi:putative two-component system response regulator